MAAFTSTAAVQPVNQDRLSIRLTPRRRRSSFLGRNSSGRHHGREGKPAEAAEERYGANSFLASPATIQSGSLRWLDRVSMLELPRQPAAAARLRLTADAVRLPRLRVSAELRLPRRGAPIHRTPRARANAVPLLVARHASDGSVDPSARLFDWLHVQARPRGMSQRISRMDH